MEVCERWLCRVWFFFAGSVCALEITTLGGRREGEFSITCVRESESVCSPALDLEESLQSKHNQKKELNEVLDKSFTM